MRATLIYAAVALGGTIAGSTATYLWLSGDDPAAAGYFAAAVEGAARAEPPADRSAARPRSRAVAPGFGRLPTSDRFAVYAYAADTAEPDALESMIRRAAGQPPSHRRAFELDALLMRLAEIDAGRAVRLASELRLETEHLVPLFQFWAERDADASLAVLRGIDDPGRLRAVALALLDVLGDDQPGIERLATVLSPAQLPAFRLDAAVRLAAQDPYAAIQRALALDDQTLRAAAMTRIAAEWTKHDPAAALASIDTITDNEMRTSFQSAVLSEWARIDPDGVFAYLRSGDTRELPILAAVMSALAPADPEAVLELAAQLPADGRRFAQQAALRVIADRDPYAALAMLDAMPSNRDRDQLVSAVGQAFARRDPDGALEWAKSLRPPSPNAIMNVVGAIAASDPDRAVDIMLDGDLGANVSTSLPFMLVASSLSANLDSSRIGAIADRLLDRSDPLGANQIQTLITGWSRSDPDAALDWFIDNAERAGRAALTQLAAQLAAEDPIAAANVMNRLPPGAQGPWLQSVAAGYAQYDPQAAAAWIMQYQGRDGFPAGLAAIAPRLAQTDLEAAVRMLDQVGGPLAPVAFSQVASTWAASDPAAAAEWSAQQSDPAVRSQAVGAVTNAWAIRDPDGAQRWALGLPSGESRDQALQRLLPIRVASSGDVDRQLLDAFSNDSMRQDALLNAVMQLANRDPSSARQLADRHMTDPVMRQRAYDLIERSGASPSFQSLMLR